MRAGACTIQQALTAEAAAILKHSLSLARRRGHAQVTPLHVAATLLNSSSSASSLLRRACIRSRPHHPHSLHLQCRALELCFNVALNRLPTSPPPSTSPLHHPHPSLSNALIAALKRAQAHQRRGCIESQNSHSHQSQQQTNQPLLAIKVELEQLIISILDDPSVSRVMREAGFSSTSVKQSLEEESTAGFAMAACSRPPPFFDNGGVFFPAQFMKPAEKKEEDVKVVLEVMLRRKQQQPRKRAVNAVVVGDSASMAEDVVDELLMRLERGEVPVELRGAQVIKLQLSYVHLRLMSRIDVEMKISDLRRRVFSSLEKGVIVYAGDLRWAVGEEDRDGAALSRFKPAEYFVLEVGRFLSELKSGINGRVGGERAMVWVLAFSSYQTYMRCKTMNPCLESQWALQAVVVPSGGLALSLHAPSGMDSVVPKLKQYQFQTLEHNRAFNGEEEEDKLICCAECVTNYEKEAVSVLKPETNKEEGIIAGSSHLPFWLQNKKPEKLYKETLFELRRKWSRLCRSLHHPRISQVPVHPPPLISKACPWWSNSLPSAKRKLSMEPTSISLAPESNLKLSRKPIVTALALCSPVITDSETSTDGKSSSLVSPGHLSKKLQENIPWQSETIHSVVNALLDCRSREKKGSCILIHGNDLIAKRRLARVVAELLGSVDGVLRINLRESKSGYIDLLKSSLEKESKSVVLIEGVECANPEFIKLISDGIRIGFLMDSRDKEVDLANLIFILSSSPTETAKEVEDSDRVLQMRMREGEEEVESALSDEKLNPARAKKKLRTDVGDVLDLNVAFTGHDEGEACAGGEEGIQLPASAVFNFETNVGVIDRIAEGFAARLQKEFEETASINGKGGRLVVEQDLVAELAAASGFFLEAEFDRWVREVFKICIPTVKKGGKVRLGMEGKEGNFVELGFLCSPLPKKISVN